MHLHLQVNCSFRYTNFQELKINEQNYVEVFCVEIHVNQSIIMENMGTVANVLNKIMTVTKPMCIKFIFSWQLYVNNP
jgi:hypothetical protein